MTLEPRRNPVKSLGQGSDMNFVIQSGGETTWAQNMSDLCRNGRSKKVWHHDAHQRSGFRFFHFYEQKWIVKVISAPWLGEALGSRGGNPYSCSSMWAVWAAGWLSKIKQSFWQAFLRCDLEPCQVKKRDTRFPQNAAGVCWMKLMQIDMDPWKICYRILVKVTVGWRRQLCVVARWFSIWLQIWYPPEV